MPVLLGSYALRVDGFMLFLGLFVEFLSPLKSMMPMSLAGEYTNMP